MCIFVVTGFSQKNVIRKKYIKYDGKAKGGYFGVNINGELSTSTDKYSLDIRFGLEPTVIKPFEIQHLVSAEQSGVRKIDKDACSQSISEFGKIGDFAADTKQQLVEVLKGQKLSKLIKAEEW